MFSEHTIPICGQIVKMLLPSCQLSLADVNTVLVTNFRYSISNINSNFSVGIRISQNHMNQVHQFLSYLVTDKARQRSDLGQIDGGDGQGAKYGWKDSGTQRGRVKVDLRVRTVETTRGLEPLLIKPLLK